MSIAYLDPGNIESDLQAGSVAQYKVRVNRAPISNLKDTRWREQSGQKIDNILSMYGRRKIYLYGMCIMLEGS